MSHDLDLTPGQLTALREPWAQGDTLDGLALLRGVVKGSRPMAQRYRADGVEVDAWLVVQQLQGGAHRAVVFSPEGRVLAFFHHEKRSTVRRWVEDNLAEP